MGELEVMNDMKQKMASAKPVWLGCSYNVCSDEHGIFLCQYCALKTEDVFADWNNSYLHPDDLLEFSQMHSLTNNIMLHTAYNFLDYNWSSSKTTAGLHGDHD